jgi:hypothetical protein
MSSRCFGRVQDESRNRGTAYTLLIMLADCAQDDGTGYCPDMKHLAHAIRVSERQVPRVLQALEKSGELIWNNPPGYFSIHVGAPPTRPEPTRPWEVRKCKPGYIYLIKSAHGHKIGKTNHVPTRVGAFTLQLPFPTKLIHSMPTNDMMWAEAYLHQTFAHCRINGEWFDLSPDEVAWICDIESINPG